MYMRVEVLYKRITSCQIKSEVYFLNTEYFTPTKIDNHC